MVQDILSEHRVESAAGIAAAIGARDFTRCAATVIGYGTMGKQHVRALRALGVRQIRVCTRSADSLQELRAREGIEAVGGGVERLRCAPTPGELGIVATPIQALVPAAECLAALGFRRLLIEKPVSLWSQDIERLADALEPQGIDAVCAYNRIAYPAFHEVAARSAQEGGMTSCTYTFTEHPKPDWPARFLPEELARWGIANSLHVMSMAHSLIGWPASWSGYRAGSLPWHPTGAVFAGAGVSDRHIPFSYHADWGSTGRWSIEVHTPVSSYRLCPLERVWRKTSASGEWEELPIVAYAVSIKAGVLEQVAAALNPELRQQILLVTIRQAATLTRYAEALFGYPGRRRD